MSGTATAQVVVDHEQGMHLRPATEFARVALASGCAVRVKANGIEVDGTSVLELAMMGAPQGTVLVIRAEGANCLNAVQALVALVKNDFKR